MALATAQPFTPPTVERLSVRLVVDSYFDLFMPKASHPHVRIEHVSRIPGRETSTLAGEWGLSLHLESETAGDKHQYLVDFGYTPEILLRNFDLLGIETEKLDGLILSHSHRDHYGGLVGFVGAQRSRLRQEALHRRRSDVS
jgi:7,8-dihydropterin-6-yl-methyl-4-(beta-D-ribofuranosyl)aminobenzene 5'-phosphate synthase